MLLLPVFALAQTTFSGQGNSTQEISFSTLSQIENADGLRVRENGLVLENFAATREVVLKPVRIGLKRPQPFVSSYLQVSGEGLDHHRLTLYQRSATSRRAWTDWRAIPFDGHGEAETDKTLTSALTYLDKRAKRVQYKLEIQPGKAMRIDGMTLAHYSPGATPPEVLEAIQMNGQATSEKASCGRPAIVSRSQWGARPPRSNFGSSKVTHLIVHHEFGSNSSSDWAARVRSVQNFHMNSNGWSDVGYNFLIDPNGVVYEGRAGGDSSIGAHFCGRNRGTMGTCMLGNYSTIQPTSATQNALARLLAWKASKENIDPTGTAYHYSVSGQLRTIAGHRDGGGCSACPGDGGYAILPALRTNVQGLINDDCSGSGGGGGGSDTTPPTTSISAPGGSSQPSDFTATFTDQDNVGVTRRFYQTLEKYGSEWYANRNIGFFNDNCNLFYTGYDVGSGSWSTAGGHLKQTSTGSTNTRLSSYLIQNSGLPYLYEFAAKVNSTSGPRKFGIHIMSDNATQSQRGNSYLIWFSGAQSKLYIYETVNNVLQTRASVDLAQNNNWANYKITYSPAYGVIEVFKDNSSLLRWTDTTPIPSGNAISLRTNATNVSFDDIKVYKYRGGSTEQITVGTASTDAIRRSIGKVKSLVRDAAGNWSAPGNLDVAVPSLNMTLVNTDNPVEAGLAFTLSPNPTDGAALRLTFTGAVEGRVDVRILDKLGRPLGERSFNAIPTEGVDVADLAKNLPTGAYFLQVVADGRSEVRGFMVR